MAEWPLRDVRNKSSGSGQVCTLSHPQTIVVFDANSAAHYYCLVIRSYRDRDTQAVAERRRVRRFPEQLQRQAQRKLMMINNASDLNDLRIPPRNRLEALSGDRDGQFSIRIND